jgi:chromosome transmission fidelity protein 1
LLDVLFSALIVPAFCLCSETLGIRLKGAILIVDEAHNLPEAVADSAAAALTGSAAATAAAALSGYLTRYRSRLSAGNLRHLATLLTAARALQRTVAAASGGDAPKTDAGAAAGKALPARPPAAAADATRVLRLNEFLFEAGIDHMNMFKLSRYCRDRRAVFGVFACPLRADSLPRTSCASQQGAQQSGRLWRRGCRSGRRCSAGGHVRRR